MLIILLTWICITILVYPAGVLLHTLLKQLFRLETVNEHFSIHCISGLLVTSFISCLLCLFIPIGLISNLLLSAISLAGVVLNRKDTRNAIGNDLQRLKKGQWTISLVLFAFVIVFSYLSYLPSSHYDDGLYYSTGIKWLQEYGTIKGLANLSQRIGYNSSWHILQANFGFRFLHAGLFNDLNGLLIVYMLLYSAGGINNLIKGNNSAHNCVRSMIMIPVLLFHFGAASDIILFNVNLVSSSSADIPACLITWLIFMLFLKKRNDNQQAIQLTDILVILYSAWNLSIKLSVLPIVLLSIYLVYRLVISRKFNVAVLLVLLSLIFILPWLIRNIYISGYLLFPFSAIDIFQVEWKLPLSQVKWNENAVRAFALGVDLEKPFNIPFTEWFPAWLGKANFIQQVSLGLVMIATVTYILIVIRWSWSRSWNFFRRNEKDIVGLVTCFAGILFWLYKAPDFRFGYGFICFYCIYFIAITSSYFLEDSLHYLFLPIALYMAAVLIFYYKDRWMSARLLFAKPLEYRMPVTLKQIPLSDKLHMNIVSQEDSWNAPLPVANEQEFIMLKPGLIGTSIEQGFKSNKKGN